jgi:FtsZ-binding cell division protein ZapB
MITELDKLEERIAEAADTIRVLKERNRELAARIAAFERERSQFLEERSALAERIARLVERVDALRTEL